MLSECVSAVTLCVLCAVTLCVLCVVCCDLWQKEKEFSLLSECSQQVIGSDPRSQITFGRDTE